MQGDGDDDELYVEEGSSVLFSLTSQEDFGVKGTIITITAFSSAACEALESVGNTFKEGTFSFVPHGRFQSTVDTNLGTKRLVRIVGSDKDATGSEKLAMHLTIEDDSATAYQPCPADGKNTLADHVIISRCIIAFHNEGWESCISPSIESIVTRRDYHGNDLTMCLFDVVETWFLCLWTLDIKEGSRMLQATRMSDLIVDGVPAPVGGRGSGSSGAGGDEADDPMGECGVARVVRASRAGFVARLLPVDIC